MARRRSPRDLIPLALVGVLGLASAGVAVAAGIDHQPASGLSTFFDQALDATTHAGTAQFIYTSSTAPNSLSAGSSTRGFGSVNFGTDTSDAYLVTTSPGPSAQGLDVPPSSTSSHEQEIATRQGTFIAFGGAGSPPEGWIRIYGAPLGGSMAALENSQAGAGLVALTHLPANAVIRRAGHALVGGVATTAYNVPSPLITCQQAEGAAPLAGQSVLRVWIDRTARIRRVQLVTTERIPRGHGRHPLVLAFNGILTFTTYGIPVHVSAPKATVGSQDVSAGKEPSLRGCAPTGWVAYAPLSNG
jgi:hypothetical protein